jgi:hypothetical protein
MIEYLHGILDYTDIGNIMNTAPMFLVQVVEALRDFNMLRGTTGIRILLSMYLSACRETGHVPSDVYALF